MGLTSLIGSTEVLVLMEVCVFVLINVPASGGCELRNVISLLGNIFEGIGT
jgi:hypothetical protein